MNNMLLKVCGMRHSQNIADLGKLDVNMMGFIFYSESKRDVTDKLKIEVFQAIPKTTETVAVFVNPKNEFVDSIVSKYPFDMIQFHGKEAPSQLHYWKKRGFKITKAFHVDDAFNFSDTLAYEGLCDYFLFDSKGRYYGGNGFVFNWLALKNYQGQTPFLLSGGLDESVIEKLPWLKDLNISGLDLNSKMELEPAVKDIHRIEKFIHQLQKPQLT